jgi:hypothetical protein
MAANRQAPILVNNAWGKPMQLIGIRHACLEFPLRRKLKVNAIRTQVVNRRVILPTFSV